VRVSDIAAGLAREARFNGHTHTPNGAAYSVAQHSVHGHGGGGTPGRPGDAGSGSPGREPLFPNPHGQQGPAGPGVAVSQALFHDASEGLGLRDLPSPVKQLPEMAGYRALEKGVMDAVMSHLGLPLRLHQLVKAADYRMCQTEAKWFLGDLHPDWETSTEFPAYDMRPPESGTPRKPRQVHGGIPFHAESGR
jgi:hypothetical protein